jgi:hypothetical protein
MTSRRTRTAQVRPRPPSTGRPAPARRTTGPRPLAPSRIAPHRRIERGPGLPLAVRVLLVVGIVALGGVVVFAGMGIAGKAVAGLGSAFAGTISQITTTPSPSPSDGTSPDAPTLTAPDQAYTNQATIDLSGTVPAAFVGKDGVSIRVYRSVDGGAEEQVGEIPVGRTPRFTVSDLELAAGKNAFTTTLVSDTGESTASKAVTYIFDKTKPKVTISKPTKNQVVNGDTVTVQGKTQAGSTLVARNTTNGASVTGKADAAGAFKLVVALRAGVNAILVTATDPAGNQGQAAVNVSRGKGKVAAELTASSYRFSRKNLPRNITLTVTVTDANGKPLDGATVTFTLTVPGVGPIQRTLTTSNGVASWRTTIPKGATVGRGVAAALVQPPTGRSLTAQTSITIGP